MLKAHPSVLQNLMDQYTALRTQYAQDGDVELRTRMNDAAYTLCVVTGTREVDTALIVARHQLSGDRADDEPALSA